MSLQSFGVIFCSVCLSALAQFSFKLGVNRVHVLADASIVDRAFQFFFSPFVMLGISLYGVGTVLWLFALKQLDLSLAYPFVGISFIMVFILGVAFLDEPFSINKLMGTFIIIIGLLVMART